jgi:hypothetical protein
VTCEALIAEAFHLLRRVHGAGGAVVANVAAGIFHISPSDILTLDRNFEIYRGRGNRAFRLLIPPPLIL